MIFLSLGNKAISGRRINNALEKIISQTVDTRVYDGFIESVSSFEFVPRVCDWHYRKEYIFFFRRNAHEYLLRIIPVNTQLRYREIGFVPYKTRNYNTRTAKPLIIPEKNHELIKSISELCNMIVADLLRNLDLI